ncbi:PucR family transcriptional regulator [Haloechinothrix salitolerans]|uniref:PucR family transcriptional regulator n=1 Tax=Haloechinothrix salitolerans TaxID=926830 RepID=A0ABW2C0W5_9PSEU
MTSRSALVPLHPDRTDRAELSDLRALLALSMVMTEAADASSVLALAAEAVSSLTRCHVEGILLADGGWRQTKRPCAGRAMRAHLEDQISAFGAMGGPVDLPTESWAWAYPMRSLRGNAGFVVTGSEQEPSPHEQFQLRVLAQQTGLALTNAAMHEMERRNASELALLNERLEETVAALRQGMQIHQRLTDAAASGVGVEGITNVVHELTGLPVVVEYRDGVRGASAGIESDVVGLDLAGRRRDKMLAAALDESRSIRHGDRWLALARARDEILGVMVLIDQDDVARPQDLMALEYGATVLASELAHVRNIAETELRLRRDIVEDLLAGTDGESVLMRAKGLRYDLERPHRVVIVQPDAGVGSERLFRAVRQTATECDVGSLLVSRADAVILLVHTDMPWEKLHTAIQRRLGEGSCRLVAGGRCARASGFPQSYQQAQFALRLLGTRARSLCFDDLGVLKVFGSVADPGDIEDLARQWLDDLLTYDREHGGDLVATLSAFLDCGGNHEQTADTLLIHRSTLKYRLKRIREVSGHDLGDPDTHLHLHLATRAWQVLGVITEA